ncbi:MAG: peptidoglycan DD-metalloendopeptidase family protein [Bryobacter sp.]|nr:peptidoglycan DD-metalloendopeptidase family protein [Bryobacter sp.]
MRPLILIAMLAVAAPAATVSQPAFGSSAQEKSCAVAGPGREFEPTTRQVFFRFVMNGLRGGERMEIQWIDPQQTARSVVTYEDLPAGRSLCLLSQLPVAGFEAANLPGNWIAQVVLDGVPLGAWQFRILADPNAGRFGIRQVKRRDLAGGRTELTIDGAGFGSSTIVNVARYTVAGGWQFLAHEFPNAASETQLRVEIPRLAPAEYLVILKNPDESLSAPGRFWISTGGYRAPGAMGETWVLTQGPYGGFSHWGRSLHAYDFAPRTGGCVVAMKPGVAHARDFGYGQTPHLRIFGNYVTIQHDDGEYSHYAHLKAGTFLVGNGQRVEAGQPLAVAGNSGYSFGRHVHVHVTREPSISAQSIPFRFEDLPPGMTRGEFVSRNVSSAGSCWSNPETVVSGVGGLPQ